MQNFVFENPTKIIFGCGQISKIGREVSRFGKKVLLVYGQGSIKRIGVYGQVTTSLEKAGVSIVEFPDVKPNPVLSHALKGIELARSKQVDVILAVGGGSVIDTAKTIAAGVKTDRNVWDFFTNKRIIRDALPLLTVVTVAASASEMNSAAVITKEEGAHKFSIRSPFIFPKTSVLDPAILFTLSPEYCAYGAVDAITHMLEGYYNNTNPHSSLQDRLIEGITETIMESTEIILKEPSDYAARSAMMWSATLAFNGITSAGMGIVSLPAHMIEHSLSALYDIAHGAGLSIVLPGWMLYSVAKNPGKFARFAREIFKVEEPDESHAAQKGIKLLKGWFASIGCPTTLKGAGIPESDIEKIAENAYELANVWKLKDYYTKDIIIEILNLCR